MRNVLSITTSLFEEGSVSTQLTNELLEALKGKGADFQHTRRDFQEQAIPHLDGQWLQSLMTPETERTEEQAAKVSFSDSLIEEVKAADTILIALPMYNFSVPSMLKAWVDHIARAGTTFKYTSDGSVGLLEGKKAYFLVAMGGFHEAGGTDFLRPYMQQIMNFIGITDVEIITAEGLNVSEQSRENGIEAARDQMHKIVDELELDLLGEVA